MLRWELCDPGHNTPGHHHEPAPIPRFSDAKEVNSRDYTDDDPDTDPRELPAGTCQAMNPELRGNKAAQEQWNRWCDQNCIPEKWGGVGTNACHGGTATGTVGCLCKAGVRPIDPIAVQRKESEAAAKAAAKESEAVAAEEARSAAAAEEAAAEAAAAEAARSAAAEKVAAAKQKIEEERRAEEEAHRSAEADRATQAEREAERAAAEGSESRRAEAAKAAEARAAEAAKEAAQREADSKAEIEALEAAAAAEEKRAKEAGERAAEAGAIAAARNGEPWNAEKAAEAEMQGVAAAKAEASEEARAAAEVQRRKEEAAAEAARRRQQQQEMAEAAGDSARVAEIEAEKEAEVQAAKAAAAAASTPAKASAPLATGSGYEPPEGATSSLPPEAAGVDSYASESAVGDVFGGGNAPDTASVAPEAAAAPTAGSCLSTNPDLSSEARQQWNGWCVEQCRPPAGDPENCRTPDLTGAAMCACLD